MISSDYHLFKGWQKEMLIQIWVKVIDQNGIILLNKVRYIMLTKPLNREFWNISSKNNSIKYSNKKHS